MKKSIPYIVGLFVVNSVALCFAHFLTFRSFWLDEAFVAVNLRNRTLTEIFGPLEYGQQFPRLYLAGIMVLKNMLGYETAVLRLLPFLFGVSTVILGSWLLWREFHEVKPVPLFSTCAVLAFLGNHFVYYYAGELKQYSGDLFWALFSIWYTKKYIFTSKLKSYLQISIHIFLMFLPTLFSMTYLFVLFPILTIWLCRLYQLKKKIFHFEVLPLILCSILFLFASYWIDIRFSQSVGLNGYWKDYFISGNSSSEILLSTYRGISNILGRWWVEPATLFFTTIGFIGVYSALRSFRLTDSFRMSQIGALLLFELIVLAILKQYPLEYGRTALFFFPFACALIVEGVLFLKNKKSFLISSSGSACAFLIIALMVFWKTPINSRYNYIYWHWENLNPTFDYLRKQEKGITVVYSSAAVAQVRAAPHLPENARYVFMHDLKFGPLSPETKEILSHSFFFLIGQPNGEQQELLSKISEAGYQFSIETVTDHLLLFKPT